MCIKSRVKEQIVFSKTGLAYSGEECRTTSLQHTQTELSITKLPGSLFNDAYKSLYKNKLWLKGFKCLQRKCLFPGMFSNSFPLVKSLTLVTTWPALVPNPGAMRAFTSSSTHILDTMEEYSQTVC